MASFQIVKEALQVTDLQIYEDKFRSLKFDDNTVLNCISDRDLLEQLRLHIIPELADFVNFTSKFKQLHTRKSTNGESRRCDKPYVFKNEPEDGEVLKGTEETTSKDANTNAIPLPPPMVSDVSTRTLTSSAIPLPPPILSTENAGSITYLAPAVIPPPFLAELLQKKLTPISFESENSPNLQERDDGYPPSISSVDLEEDQKLIDPANGANVDLVNEFKRRNATMAAINGEDRLRKIEEMRLKRSNSVTTASNPGLSINIQRRTSEDMDVLVRRNKEINKQSLNVDTNNRSGSESPKPMVKLRKSEPKLVQTSEGEGAPWQNEIQIKRSGQKSKKDIQREDNSNIADINTPDPDVQIIRTPQQRSPAPPLPAKPKKSTVTSPSPKPRLKMSDKMIEKTISGIQITDRNTNSIHPDSSGPSCSATIDASLGNEQLCLPLLPSKDNSREIHADSTPLKTVPTPTPESLTLIQEDISQSQILTEIENKPKPVSCPPPPPPPPPQPTQFSHPSPSSADIASRLMFDIRNGIELRKVGDNSKVTKPVLIPENMTSQPVNSLQDILAQAMGSRRPWMDISDTDSDSDDDPNKVQHSETCWEDS